MRVTPLQSLYFYQSRTNTSKSLYQPVRMDEFRPSFGKGQTSQQTSPDPTEAARIQAVNALFNGSLESRLEFKQSPKIGNCYFLATIDAFWHNPYGKRIIRDMFSFPPQSLVHEKIYRVVFPERHSRSIDVYESDLKGQVVKHRATKGEPPFQVTYTPGELVPSVSTTAKGLKILEIAYAKLRAGTDKLKLEDAPNDPLVDLYAWTSDYVMGLMIKSGVVPVVTSSKAPGESLQQAGKASWVRERLQQIAEHPDKYAVTAGTIYPPNYQYVYLDPKKQIVPAHCYTVRFVRPDDERIVLTNPQDNAQKLVISYEDFFKYFQCLTAIDLSKAQN